MVKIHRLRQPNKHSGKALQPGQTIKMRGVEITNTNTFVIHVDKFSRKPWKPNKKSPKKAAEEPKAREGLPPVN